MTFSIVTIEVCDDYPQEFTVIVPSFYVKNGFVLYSTLPENKNDVDCINSFVISKYQPPPSFSLYKCTLQFELSTYKDAKTTLESLDKKYNKGKKKFAHNSILVCQSKYEIDIPAPTESNSKKSLEDLGADDVQQLLDSVDPLEQNFEVTEEELLSDNSYGMNSSEIFPKSHSSPTIKKGEIVVKTNSNLNNLPSTSKRTSNENSENTSQKKKGLNRLRLLM